MPLRYPLFEVADTTPRSVSGTSRKLKAPTFKRARGGPPDGLSLSLIKG
jgi:hypothetical protein